MFTHLSNSNIAKLILLITIFGILLVSRGPIHLSHFLANTRLIALNTMLSGWPQQLSQEIDVNAYDFFHRVSIMDHPQIKQWRGDSLLLQGKTTEAISFWQDFEVGSEQFVLRGKDAFEIGNFELAVAWFDLAVEVVPEDGFAWYGKALAQMETAEYEEALLSFQNSIELAPGDYFISTIHFHMGRIYQRRLDPPNVVAAENSFQKALANDEFENSWEKVLSLIALGEIYQSQEQYEDAMILYNEAIRLDPESYWAKSRLGLILLTTAADDNQEQISQAEKLLQEAILIDPTIPAAYRWLALLYRQQGSLDEAEKYYRFLLEVDPGDETALEFLGE